jgi:hypothetical protein
MHGGAGPFGGSSQVDSGGELASALATVTTLHKMRERVQIVGHKFVVGKSPGDWGNAESQRCGIPYVRFMLQRFHFCKPPHSVACVGCKGLHGDQGVAHDPKLSPPTSLFLLVFCTSAFREKRNPEEMIVPNVVPRPPALNTI